VCREREALNRLSESLYSVVAGLEGLGVARSADDLRAVADDLRDIPDGGPTEDVRVGVSIDKLMRISTRLARSGFTRSAEDLERLLDDLRRLRRSPPHS
jgi:hypothetical protein